VFFRVGLCSFHGMLVGVLFVCAGCVSVVRGLLVVAGLVMLRRLLVMMSRMFVMLCCFVVMLCCLFGHDASLLLELSLQDNLKEK
jgi:hypothetical protein